MHHQCNLHINKWNAAPRSDTDVCCSQEVTSFSTVNWGCERAEASCKNSMLAGKQSGFKKEVRGLISVSCCAQRSTGKIQSQYISALSTWPPSCCIFTLKLRFLCRSLATCTVAQWLLRTKALHWRPQQSDAELQWLRDKDVMNIPGNLSSGETKNHIRVRAKSLTPSLQRGAASIITLTKRLTPTQ